MRCYMLQKILILYSFLILWLILVAKVHIIFGFIKCEASIVFENVNYLCYLTLEELSKLTNISESELDKIELGKIKTPSSVFLFRLSKVLNLDYNEMLKYRFASYYRKKGILNA